MTQRGSALRSWLVQRVSAVYIAAFAFYVGWHLFSSPPESYAAWRSWVAGPPVGMAWALFVLALITHAWVGMRDVVMDYVRPTGWRLGVLALLGLILAGYGLWSLSVLFGAAQWA